MRIYHERIKRSLMLERKVRSLLFAGFSFPGEVSNGSQGGVSRIVEKATYRHAANR